MIDCRNRDISSSKKYLYITNNKGIGLTDFFVTKGYATIKIQWEEDIVTNIFNELNIGDILIFHIDDNLVSSEKINELLLSIKEGVRVFAIVPYLIDLPINKIYNGETFIIRTTQKFKADIIVFYTIQDIVFILPKIISSNSWNSIYNKLIIEIYTEKGDTKEYPIMSTNICNVFNFRNFL